LTSIGIIDYGMGNLRSVLNALAEIGQEAELIATPETVAACGRIIVPGVGAFQEAMANLRDRGMDAGNETVAWTEPPQPSWSLLSLGSSITASAERVSSGSAASTGPSSFSAYGPSSRA
jgi:hypothetical protein